MKMLSRCNLFVRARGAVSKCQGSSLIFAKVTGDTVTVSYGPCGGSVFAEPSDVTLRDMTACMNGNCP
jgi:hypothetical protein